MNAHLHTWTWFAWLVITLIVISVTRNPIYMVVILMCLLVIHFVLKASPLGKTYPISLINFGLTICGFSTLFNLLISHSGETVFFSLPAHWPLIGGNYTLEAAIYGLSNGMILVNILIAFAVFNQALPVRQLIRLIPRAFFPVAVVTSIAITFVPNTIRQFYQIKEAQLIRGQRMRGLSDWLPLVMALLVGGMERALQLSEAMTARGFASSGPGHTRLAARLAMLAGLLLVTAGWILLNEPAWQALGWGIILVGVVLLSGALWWVGRQNRRTTYPRETWRLSDTLVLAGIGVLGLALLFPLEVINQKSLYYSVYPLFRWPQFDPWIGTALLVLVLPAYLIGLKKE